MIYVTILRLIIGVTVLALPREEQRKRYDGYQVLRVNPVTNKELEVLQNLEKQTILQVDFWSRPTALNAVVDIMVPPQSLSLVTNTLTGSGMAITVSHSNVQEIVEKELIENIIPAFSRVQRSFSFTEYQTLSSINNYLDYLATNYPEIASTEIIGHSYENRPLKIIKIGKPKAGGLTKPAIWIDGGIHAREWISPATVMYIVNKLVTEYATNNEIKNLVNNLNWFILPVSNPDGYEYTWTTERLWRKTRSKHVKAKPWWCPWCPDCVGVDPNRNWGHKWMTGGSDSDPCSDTYAGPTAFSEKETKAMADFIWANKNQLKVYLSFHSFSQLWLTPWGYTKTLPADYNELESLARKAVNALTAVYGTRYRIGSSTNVLYAASGGSDDWAKGDARIKYSYCVELRDEGNRGGFTLSKSEIIPSGKETWESIKVIGIEILAMQK